jgi:hypothetical protein
MKTTRTMTTRISTKTRIARNTRSRGHAEYLS